MVRKRQSERLVDFEADGPRVLGRIARARTVGGLRLAPATPSRTRLTYCDNDLGSVARGGFDLAVHRVAGGREILLVEYPPEGRHAFRERVWIAPFVGALQGPLRLPDGPLRERLLPLSAGRPVAPFAVVSLSARVFDLRRAGRRTTVVARLDLEAWTIRAAPGEAAAVRLHGVRVRSSVLGRAAIHDLVDRIALEFELRPIRKGRMARAAAALQGDAASPEIPGGNVRFGDTRILAARRVLSGQLRRLRKHDPGTREGTDPEELHDMRVATRRMRAALRTYGPALPPSVRRRLTSDLRWLGRRLGAVRDVDVLLERFAASGADPRLLEHLRRRRAVARDRMLPALRSARYLRLVSTLDAVCRGWSVEPLPDEALLPAATLAATRARKAMERLVREGDAAMERPDADRLHQTRIRAKRLRYILEFHRVLGGAPCAGLIRRLKAAQDHLGAHQDAVVADAEVRAFLREQGDALDASARAAWQEVLERLQGDAAVLRSRWRGRWRRLRDSLTGPPGVAALLALQHKKGDARPGVP